MPRSDGGGGGTTDRTIRDEGGGAAAPRRKRQRGPRHGHTLRGLLDKTTPLTWQQKLELEDLQRRRSRMLASGRSPPRNAAGRTRTADDDGRDFEPPSPYKTTEVSDEAQRRAVMPAAMPATLQRCRCSTCLTHGFPRRECKKLTPTPPLPIHPPPLQQIIEEHEAAGAVSEDGSYDYEGVGDLLSSVIVCDAHSSVLDAAVAHAGEITQTSTSSVSHGSRPAGASAASGGNLVVAGAGASAASAERRPPNQPPRSRTLSFDLVQDLAHVDETTPVSELLQRVRTLQMSCRRLLDRALASEAENGLLRNSASEEATTVGMARVAKRGRVN